MFATSVIASSCNFPFVFALINGGAFSLLEDGSDLNDCRTSRLLGAVSSTIPSGVKEKGKRIQPGHGPNENRQPRQGRELFWLAGWTDIIDGANL